MKPFSINPARILPLCYRLVCWLVAAGLLSLSLGCTMPQPSAPPLSTGAPLPAVQQPAAEQGPQAQITFRVRVPQNTPLDQPVQIYVLDEVAGLALHPDIYEMVQEDDLHWIVQLSFPLGSVVKYRYSRQTEVAPVNEHTSVGRQTRYRLVYAQAPGLVDDVISRWTDTPFAGEAGRIMGQANDVQSGEPVPGLLVTAGGAQAFSAADGSFILEGLPPGTHNLVAYALDGAYRTFQQGAVVADQSTTQAPLLLQPSARVQVTFNVSVPPGTVPGVPVRLAGNLLQLGNTFADLSGGFSTLANRMPVLSPTPEGGYRMSLSLPAGADVSYLYTLGDGFWNAEKTVDGEFRLRRLVVPPVDTQVNDTIDAWAAPGTQPLVFDVTVPADTPPTDRIAIQFNPLIGWTEPLPMWSLGENRWVYMLNSPLDLEGSLRYRVCRNEQCSAADDAETSGPQAAGFAAQPTTPDRKLSTQVSRWAWLDPLSANWNNPGQAVLGRGADFIAGVEFLPQSDPSWTPYLGEALADVQATRANWVVLAPTWSYPALSLPILEQTPGADILWPDLAPVIRSAGERSLQVAVFPGVNFSGSPQDWWNSAQRDFPWWVVWFEQYRKFVLHHAVLAARTGSGALVLGGDWVTPALPGGRLDDGTPSGVPADAETRWRSLIAEVRQVYQGRLLWAMAYGRIPSGAPAFIDAFDQVYLLFSEPLTIDPQADPGAVAYQAGQFVESTYTLYEQVQKPIVLAVAYGSFDGAATACAPDGQGSCLPLSRVLEPGAALPGLAPDLQEQALVYESLMAGAAARGWIAGFVSQGYYPPAALQDLSASVHGKPAQQALAYWFANLLLPPVP